MLQHHTLTIAQGTPAEQAMAALAGAEGVAVRAGGFDNLLIARFERNLGWRSLWSMGALAGLDPAVAGACAAFLRTPSRSGDHPS